MSEHLEHAFTTYVQATLPPTAHPAQRARARCDFYAGATALLTLLAQHPDDTAADGILAQLFEELQTYTAQLAREQAGEDKGT